MHRMISNRELGGTNSLTNKGRNYGWNTPQPSSDMYLERFETAPYDLIHLSRYTQGLPIACQFGRGKGSYLCAVTDEEGQVMIFDTRPGAMASGAAVAKYWQAHDNAVFDFSWINGDSQCLTASGDQVVTLWDIETTTKLTNFRGHNCSVRSVAPCPGNPAQCASGARDGHVMLWDSRVNKKAEGWNGPVKSIEYAHSLSARAELRSHRRLHRAGGPKGVIDTQQSVTCVLYQTDKLLISSGANDGCVKIWDTRKWYRNSLTKLPTPLHTFDYPGQSRRLKGIVTMCMDPWKSQLFVSYTDNKVYRFEMTGAYQDPDEYVYAGHRNDTFFVRCAVSPDGNYLLSGSGKNTGVVWQVEKPEQRPVFLIGHTEDVSAVDWCPTDMCKLATLSDDMSLRIWRPDPRERGTEDPDILGFAFSSSAGKPCQRQARVHIVQDEFPFRLPTAEDSGKSQPDSASPGSRAPQAAKSEPSMKQVFQATQPPLRRSPRKLHLRNCPPASLSQAELLMCKEPITPPSEVNRLSGGEQDGASDRENGQLQRRLAPRHLKFQSPQQTGNACTVESSPSSPSMSVMSPSQSSRESGAIKDSTSTEAGAPVLERLCLKSIDTNSPSKKESTKDSWSSPKKCPIASPFKNSISEERSPHLYMNSPRRSPRKHCSPSRYESLQARRLIFSSPTANLPNSVLELPKLQPTTPTGQRKRDWLTEYRLSRSDSKLAAVKETVSNLSPGAKQKSSHSTADDIDDDVSTSASSRNGSPLRKGASQNITPNTKGAVVGKGSDKSLTPKRKNSVKADSESEDAAPQKRRKTTTPGSVKRASSLSSSKPCSSSNHRRKSLVESPQTPTSMSIRRYLL